MEDSELDKIYFFSISNREAPIYSWSCNIKSLGICIVDLGAMLIGVTPGAAMFDAIFKHTREIVKVLYLKEAHSAIASGYETLSASS